MLKCILNTLGLALSYIANTKFNPSQLYSLLYFRFFVYLFCLWFCSIMQWVWPCCNHKFWIIHCSLLRGTNEYTLKDSDYPFLREDRVAGSKPFTHVLVVGSPLLCKHTVGNHRYHEFMLDAVPRLDHIST